MTDKLDTQILESLLTGVFIADAKTKEIIFLNSTASDLIGYTKDEIIGTYCSEYLCQKDRAKCPITELAKSVRKIETTLVRKDGSIVHFLKTARLIKMGNRDCIIESFIDITEQKNMENSLRLTEAESRKNSEFLKTIIDALPHPFYVIDPQDYSLILANTSSGIDLSIGKQTCHKNTHQSDTPCSSDEHPCPLEEVKKTKQRFTTQHTHYDKEGNHRIYEVHGNPILDQDGVLVNMIEYSIDITERIEALEALTKSEALFRTMMEQAPIGIALADLNGNIIEIAGTWQDIFGMSNHEDALSLNLFEGPIIPADKKQELMQGNPIRYIATFDFSWVHTANSYKCSKTGVIHLGTAITPLKFGDESKIEKYLVMVQDISDQKRVEDSLKKSEERYRRFIDILPEGVIIGDIKENIMLANRAMGEILGIDSDDLIGRNFIDFVDPRFESQVRSQSRRRTSGSSSDYNIQIIRADGKLRDVHISATPHLNDQYEIEGAIGVISDITEQKKMERDLRTMTYKLQERIKEINAVFGTSELMKNINTPLETILKDIIPIICAGFQYPVITCGRICIDDHEVSSSNYDAPKETISEEIWVSGTKVGYIEMGYLELRPESDRGPFQTEEVSMISRISVDLSQFIERQRAQQEIRQQSAKLDAVTQSALDGIIMIDQDGLVQFWNPASETIFGYSEKEMLGRRLHKVILPSKYFDAHREGFKKFLHTGTGPAIGKVVELSGLKKNGLEFPVELSLTAIKLGDNWGAVGIIRDITDRKKNEQERLLQQKELEIYTTLLRHDLNNDLAGIVSSLEIVKMTMNDDPVEAEQFLASSIALTIRMGNLLRAVGRTQEFLDEPIDKMIRNVAKLSADTKIELDIQVLVEEELEGKKILAGRLLPMVFENLFRNAVQHAGETPKIIVELSVQENQIRIIVSDNGPGVPENIRDQLFQRGATTKEGGGLGLHLSKKIIEAIGGSIELMQKKKEHGAQFEIILPLSK